MSDAFDTDYATDDSDVGLDDGNDFLRQGPTWLKMNKGQILRGAFIYFHPTDVNAVAKARSDAKRTGASISTEQARAIGRKALEERAATLNKGVDALTAVERLDLSEVKMKKFWGSYQQGLGFILNRLGKDGPEADAVWKKITEPRLYFSTLLLVYPTDGKGDIDLSRVKSDCKVIPWRFGKKMYEGIYKLHSGLKSNGLGIHSQDICLECKDAQYQNIDATFMGAALWQKKAEFRDAQLAKAMVLYDKLIPFREMSTDQLRTKLGLVSPSPVGMDVSANENLDGILDLV